MTNGPELPPAPPTTTPRPSLSRGVAQVALGNGLFNLGRIAVIALLAKFTTPQFVGEFHAAAAWSTPIILFLGLELRAVLISDAGGQFSFGVYRALRTLGLGLALLILTAETARQALHDHLPAHVILLIVAVWAGRVALAWVEVFWGLFQKQERLGRMGLSNALRGIAIFLPVLITLLVLRYALHVTDPDTFARAAALAFAVHVVLWIAIGWFLDRPATLNQPAAKSDWNSKALRDLTLQAVPLGLVAVIVSLCDNVPRLIIDRQPGGTAALGFFGTLAQLPLLAQFLMVQVGTASSNRLAVYRFSDPPRFRRLLLRLTLVAAGLAATLFAAGWLAGPWLLRMLFTPDYARYAPEFIIMIAAQCVILFASIFGFVATQMRLFWQQVPIQLAVLASTWIAAVWLIPGDPVRGGAWTMLVRAIVHSTLYGVCILIGLRRTAPAK